MNEGKFHIHVNTRHYWELSLVPTPNEHEEPVCRCALIDSQTAKEIEAINFDTLYLLPIFQTRSQIGMKELATKLKEITDSKGIETTPRTEMPKDKRIKETKKVVRRIIK